MSREHIGEARTLAEAVSVLAQQAQHSEKGTTLSIHVRHSPEQNPLAQQSDYPLLYGRAGMRA